MDPLWKYVLNETSDDESYYSYDESVQSRRYRKKQVRWRLPRRSEAQSNVESRNDGDSRYGSSSTQRSRRSRKKDEDPLIQDEADGFFSFFTTVDESRTDASSSASPAQKRSKYRSRKGRADQNEIRDDADKGSVWGFFDTSNGETTEKRRTRTKWKKASKETVRSEEPKPDLFGLFAFNDRVSSNHDSENSGGGGVFGYFLDETDDDDYSVSTRDDSTTCSSTIENSAFESSEPLAVGKDGSTESVESSSVTSKVDSFSDCHYDQRRQDETEEEPEAVSTPPCLESETGGSTDLPDSGIHPSAETQSSKSLYTVSKTSAASRSDEDTQNDIEANTDNLNTDKLRSKKPVSLPKLLGLVKCRSVKDRACHDFADDSVKPALSEGRADDGVNTDDTVNTPVARTVGDHEGSSPQPDFTTADETRDAFFMEQGPQSVYVFDWDFSNHMVVQYDKFGMGETLHVSTLNFPPVAQSGTSEVVVSVEASTVSYSDCAIRRGDWWKEEAVPLPNCPGVDLVGTIHHIDKSIAAKYNLQIGDRVMSFIKWGGNARYAVVKAEQLVPVKEDIDPSAAVCLIETYLSAFQALHIGQRTGVRYGNQSLAGKSILVLGATNSMGRAVLELAVINGADKVYAPARVKHQEDLRSRGVTSLDRSPEKWPESLNRMIDLVIIADGQKNYANLSKVLHDNSHVIFVGRRVSAEFPSGKWQQLRSRAHAYDIFESWERNMGSCKRDLSYLLQLLARDVLKPTVLDCIPLDKVARAQELLQIKQFPGIVVCEPWIRGKRKAVYL